MFIYIHTHIYMYRPQYFRKYGLRILEPTSVLYYKTIPPYFLCPLTSLVIYIYAHAYIHTPPRASYTRTLGVSH